MIILIPDFDKRATHQLFFNTPHPPRGGFFIRLFRKVPLGGFRGKLRVECPFNPVLLITLLFSFTINIKSQVPDYPSIFGSDWKKAEEFLAENEGWIKPELEKYRIDYYEAMAVVFPEIVRYSALRDKMEITLLKALYINLGKDYANFSIGHFQMKPSFAELIITDGKALSGRKRPPITDSTKYEDIRSYRAAVISSLEDLHSQLGYLVIFLKIAAKKFDLKKMDQQSRIRFLATAYNYGYFHSEAEIYGMSEKKFYSVKIAGGDHYSYSDISLFWFNHSIKSLK